MSMLAYAVVDKITGKRYCRGSALTYSRAQRAIEVICQLHMARENDLEIVSWKEEWGPPMTYGFPFIGS